MKKSEYADRFDALAAGIETAHAKLEEAEDLVVEHVTTARRMLRGSDKVRDKRVFDASLKLVKVIDEAKHEARTIAAELKGAAPSNRD